MSYFLRLLCVFAVLVFWPVFPCHEPPTSPSLKQSDCFDKEQEEKKSDESLDILSISPQTPAPASGIPISSCVQDDPSPSDHAVLSSPEAVALLATRPRLAPRLPPSLTDRAHGASGSATGSVFLLWRQCCVVQQQPAADPIDFIQLPPPVAPPSPPLEAERGRAAGRSIFTRAIMFPGDTPGAILRILRELGAPAFLASHP